MSELPVDEIRDHYERIAPVVEELAAVDDSLTIGLNDYAGWYVKRDHDDFDAIDEGFEREGRCATLAKDYDTIQSRTDRALYALTTYKTPGVFDAWEPCTVTDGETEWQTGAPTPGYGDLRGVMVWGDIDLCDELKGQRGDLDAETRETVERTLDAYANVFAVLYGSEEAVYGLDSVGGAYIMGAPAATIPIADLFENDADARGRVMEAFVSRSNDWLADAQERVEERIDGAADVIDPDWVNNCNRQYKAPLSLHTDHDAVVTPLDTDSPDYTLTTFDDVNDDLIADTAAWASALTSTEPEHTDCVDTLVKRLWPDAYEQAEDWQDALESWVEAEREREQKEEEARKRARQRRRERKEQMGGAADGVPLTPFISDVYDAIDALDIERVAERTVVHKWTDSASGLSDNSGSGKRAFVPSWGPNASSGNANFVDSSSGVWVDTADDNSGGPVKLALISRDGYRRDKTPSGEDWRRGVEYLREMGFSIPIWTPDARSQDASGEDYEEMPYWAVREAAVALDVLPEDAFITAQGQQGGYERFPGKETYNHALAAIEDAGLQHNREYMTGDGDRPENANETPDSDDEQADETPEDTADTDASEATEPATEGTDSRNDFGSYSELDVEAGGYGYWKTNNDGDSWFERVTNFTFDVDSFLFKDSERIIRMTVVPGGGEPEYDVTVPSKVFNDPRRFRDNVVTGLTTTFDGSATDLNELRKLVGGQDAPVRTGTHHMGLHPESGEFVTVNGVLTGEGWEDDPDHAYIEREIGAERAFGLDPEEHTDYDAKNVTEILELLHKSRHSERFLPALGWLYAAPLRPYIQDWEGQFNTLHVTGETGAGKSSTLSLLWQLLGMDGEPMACDDTKFALLTSMASTNSIPMWFDEYKPGDMKDWEVDRFQNLMRSTTRGGVATRGNADKSTEEYHLQAPLMISGEQSIQGPAEQRRTIQTRFRDDVKESGSETKAAFAELSGMSYTVDGETKEPTGYDLSEHALAYYQFVLRQPPVQLKELWTNCRDHTRQLLAEHGITGIDDLPQQGLQTIYFGMTLYRAFADEMAGEVGIELSDLDLPAKDAVNDAMLYIARQYGDDGARKSHLDRFVELTSRAANEDYLEAGKHFKFVNEGAPDETLALKLSSVHDRVSKYVRDHGLDSEDLLNNASDYRDRMNEAADDSDSYVVTHSQKTPPLARCARIDTGMAEQKLEFSRLAFGAEPQSDDDGEEADTDDSGPDGGSGGLMPDHPDPVRIEDIDPGSQDIASVTAEVEFGEYDGLSADGGGPAWTATLGDGSAEARLVVWDEDDIPRMYDDKGVFQPDQLRVKGAGVGEYNGEIQLTVGRGTKIERSKDPGLNHTFGTDPDGDGGDAAAATDGGEVAEEPPSDDEPDGGEPESESETDYENQPVRKYVAEQATNTELTTAQVAGALNMSPPDVKHRLEQLAKRGDGVMADGDTWIVR